MATQAPAAFGLDVRRIEEGKAIDALPCSTGNSATPGNESCPRSDLPVGHMEQSPYARLPAMEILSELAQLTGHPATDDPASALWGAPEIAGACIAVTGAAGFLGSHLCERLVHLGAHVTGIDNLSTGRLANLAALDGHPAFEFRRHDITVPCRVRGDLDAIMHLASPAAPGDYLARPLETLRAGSIGTLNLAETRCPGIPLTGTPGRLDTASTAISEHARHAGSLLRRVHAITAGGYGQLTEDGTGPHPSLEGSVLPGLTARPDAGPASSPPAPVSSSPETSGGSATPALASCWATAPPATSSTTRTPAR